MTGTGSAQLTFWESLREADRGALLATGHRRAWDRGELLVRAGDHADSAIVIESGLVKIHRTGPDGIEVVFGISGPGDLLGELAVIPSTVRSASVTALERVAGVVVGVRELRDFFVRTPGAALALLELTLRRLHEADARRVEFATCESLARVSSRLVELTERFGLHREDGLIDVGLPINQEELASWSASSKESTSRALRTLRGLGLIETQRLRLIVRDLDGLRSHAAA